MADDTDGFPQSVFLKKDFRNLLFCRAYKQVGESLGALGRALGYPARDGLNGVTRDMWLGKRGIPVHRIKRLADVSGFSLKSIQTEIIPKEQNIETDSWSVVYNEYMAKIKEDRLKKIHDKSIT